MISARLRNALGAFSLTVLVVGPVASVIMLIASLLGDGAVTAALFGVALRTILLTVIGGGVLRLLVSIDARLEANR